MIEIKLLDVMKWNVMWDEIMQLVADSDLIDVIKNDEGYKIWEHLLGTWLVINAQTRAFYGYNHKNALVCVINGVLNILKHAPIQYTIMQGRGDLEG